MAVYMESLLFDLETMAPSGASPVLQLTEVMTESGPCHPGAGRGAARLLCRLALALVAALACAALAAPAPGGLFSPKELSQGYRDGVVIAKPKAAMLASIDAIERAEGLRLQARFERLGNIRVVGLAQGDTVAAAVGRLRATGRYEYVEPDFIRHITTVPDDPQFPSQWGLHNDGSGGGLAGADINAEAGWSVRSGAPSVIAAIVDSGALTTHEDLAANLWVNPSPGTTTSYASVNDNTGRAESITMTDSTCGLNAVARSGLPTDDAGHGTHVSGIMGAVGNNDKGVAGVAWQVQLMELKFIDSSGNGATSAELPCIEYATAHKASVINASFGSQGFSQAEMDAIYQAGQAGVIFVCAAGNASENNDISPFFPADDPLDNIIVVGASDNRDLPVYFSNFGSGSVSIFAPGEDILSTYYSSTSSYAYLSGTSMAAPFVTGAVALLRAQFPGDTYRETINRVLNSADTNPGLAGKCMTGGRLDLAKALNGAANTPPNALFANRTVLVGLDPYTCTNNADSPAALEAGTPQIAGTPGSHSLWWQWTAPENATVEIDTSGTGGGQYPGGSTYPTLLAVYTGTSLGALTQVASNANYGTEPMEISGTQVSYSEVSFHTTAGATYVINVQGQNGQSGQTVLAINTTPDNVSFSTPVVLTGSSASLRDANVNATLQAGDPKILSNAGGHTLWYSWTSPFTGPAQVSAYSYDFTVEAAVYTGSSLSGLTALSTTQGAAPSGTTTAASECLCAFSATAGTTYMIQVDGVTANDVGEFTLTIADAAWQASTGDAVTCSPAVGTDGTVYVGSNDNSFYAYSPNGALKWSYAAGNIFDTSSAAIGSDGTVYAGCTDGNVYAFSAGGTLKWTYTVPTPPASSGLDNGLSSSPAIAPDGTVYIHADDGNLYALNPAGTLKWKEAVAGVSYAAPTVAPDGTIYIGTDGGLLYAFNPDGSTKWTYTAPVAGEEIYTAAAIDASGNTYFGTLSGNVYSLDPTSRLRWSYNVGNGITSAPALANGAVYFAGYDGCLYSLSTTGAFNWKLQLGTQVRASAPAVDANGVVYVGCYDHNVYAVGPTGSLVRTYATDDVVRSSPVISGTSLYFGSEDHKVYAFNIGASQAAGDWPMYQFGPQRPGRAVSTPLHIVVQPASVSVSPGYAFSLAVEATGPGGITYQWSLNGAPIAGAVNATYSVASATTAQSGTYTVTVTAGGTSVTSAAAVVTVATPVQGAAGRIVNLSARAGVGTGGDVLIAGFVINGSGSKNVLLRGVGPTLASFGLTGLLSTPQLTLTNTSTNATITSAGAWGGSSALAGLFTQVGAFALPATSADCAIEVSLSAGSYTSEVAGANSTTGVALAEIYDADPPSSPSYLANLSARADVGSGGGILIGGLVVDGGPVTVLLRGVGPTLASYGVTGALTAPSIGLYDSSGTLIASNTGWANATSPGASTAAVTFRPATAADMANAGAFSLPTGSADSAMVAALPAGSYTLQLSGSSGSTGIGLVEVYLLQ
jgi:outer membrane protein assembly factor BamB/septal ring-binding cell division protein DamX